MLLKESRQKKIPVILPNKFVKNVVKNRNGQNIQRERERGRMAMKLKSLN